MSLFRKAGEKFEETKRTLMGDVDEDYVCRSCEKPLTQDYEECPYCGETAIAEVE